MKKRKGKPRFGGGPKQRRGPGGRSQGGGGHARGRKRSYELLPKAKESSSSASGPGKKTAKPTPAPSPRPKPAAAPSRPPAEEAESPVLAAWREETPSPALLCTILDRCGVPVTELQVNQFWQFHLLLRRRNREINLTRIHNFAEIALKHFVDCALAGVKTRLPAPLMDLGSGGGFPGVPLKILHPELPILLAEGRKLRVDFLEEVRRSIRLPKLYVHAGQIHAAFTSPVGGVITRAVETAEKTLARVLGCLGRGGRVILMKGPHCDEEIAAAARAFAGRFALLEDHRYSLPFSHHRRRLLVYERLDGEERSPALETESG